MSQKGRGYLRATVMIPILLVIGCGEVRHRAALESLVRDQATEAQAAQRLEMQFEVRARGTPEWEALESFLSQEPESSLRPVREAVKKYPRIMYHTTAWTMTWLFVDDKGIVRDYYVTSQ